MLRTTLLLSALTGLIMLIGQWLGGSQGLIIAFAFAILMNFGSYWFSDKIVLAAYGARQVSEAEAPMLYRIVHNLALRDGIPMPKLYILPSDAANAFATGRNPQHAAVAVTEGILQLMNERELTGVLAHELSHVTNRDILISSIAATLAGVVMMIAQMAQWAALFGGAHRSEDREGGGGVLSLLVTAIVAPLAATIIQMAISRTREYAADETGARLSGDPLGLASALGKLGAAAERTPLNASPQTAHLFMVNPLSGRSLMQLFSTHPGEPGLALTFLAQFWTLSTAKEAKYMKRLLGLSAFVFSSVFFGLSSLTLAESPDAKATTGQWWEQVVSLSGMRQELDW